MYIVQYMQKYYISRTVKNISGISLNVTDDAIAYSSMWRKSVANKREMVEAIVSSVKCSGSAEAMVEKNWPVPGMQ